MKKDENKVSTFNKEQILTSKKFTTIEKDVLNGILEDRGYTLKEVAESLKKFKEKNVKEKEAK